MIVVFDLDNTLTDEVGRRVRPGSRRLLDRLAADDHRLVLWTHSSRFRARGILRELQLAHHFERCLYREDDHRTHKDIRAVGGEFLVDDDPGNVAHVRALGLGAFRISSFLRHSYPTLAECDRVYRAIARSRRRWWRPSA